MMATPWHHDINMTSNTSSMAITPCLETLIISIPCLASRGLQLFLVPWLQLQPLRGRCDVRHQLWRRQSWGWLKIAKMTIGNHGRNGECTKNMGITGRKHVFLPKRIGITRGQIATLPRKIKITRGKFAILQRKIGISKRENDCLTKKQDQAHEPECSHVW